VIGWPQIWPNRQSLDGFARLFSTSSLNHALKGRGEPD